MKPSVFKDYVIVVISIFGISRKYFSITPFKIRKGEKYSQCNKKKENYPRFRKKVD